MVGSYPTSAEAKNAGSDFEKAGFKTSFPIRLSHRQFPRNT
ncbi:hypothetical protein [Burkholderia ubonensis]|nr:hypothetical protein [Burkholderia ubonensis]